MPESESHLEMQFEDLQQQTMTATLGMWCFLATEFLLVGAVFVSYLVCRTRWPGAFRRGSQEMHYWIGFTETGIILTTSFLVTLAARSGRLGRSRQVVAFLLLTIFLGFCFLACKATEYYLEGQEGLVPGINFQFIAPKEAHLPPSQQHPRPVQMQLFMVFYYLLTAIHAVHMSVGMAVLAVIAWMAWRGRFSAKYNTPIELAAIYWDFVDIVWIFIFATVYLLRQ